jgi:hypothetical protein
MSSNPKPTRLEHLVEILVPTQCRCGKPLPEGPRKEVLDEVKARMNEWFGGGSVRVERIEGFWSSDSGTTAEEPVDVIFSNTDTRCRGCKMKIKHKRTKWQDGGHEPEVGQVLPEVLPEPDSARVFSGFAILSNAAFTGYRRSAAGL